MDLEMDLVDGLGRWTWLLRGTETGGRRRAILMSLYGTLVSTIETLTKPYFPLQSCFLFEIRRTLIGSLTLIHPRVHSYSKTKLRGVLNGSNLHQIQ